MYLKSLELFGFKSFPDRTKLLFEKGTTIIVGPNGSGKSNISDAMRWVLGEISTKSIRGTKMEDIIFSGTETRKPMSFAEVSVTFDNSNPENRLDCPYDEVTVTRRYYRVGESEYFINRRAVKLRDIYQLFMNTGIGRDGYSIIGQGKISEIISRKSEERREIFEDASGIAKFRYQKNEAERRLSQTMDNYARANDIFLEVEAQIGPLEKEAAKAKKAIDLLDRKKEADIRLWLYNSERLRAAIDAAAEELEHAEYELNHITEALESIQSQSDRLLECSQSNKAASEELLEKIRLRTEENYKLESDYKLTERNIAHTRELIVSAESALAEYSKIIENERASSEDKKKHIKESLEVIEKLNEERKLLSEKKTSLIEKVKELRAAADRAFNDIRILEADANDIRTQIAVLRNASAGSSDSNDSAMREIEKYEQDNARLADQCESKKRLFDVYNANISKLTEKLSKLNEEYDSLCNARDSKMQMLSKMIFRRDSISQRLETFKALEEQYDGYVAGVKYVMKSYSEGRIRDRYGNSCGIIYGPLSKVISVDDKYLTAIEIALGANLQNIVVEDESTAKAAMFALKQAEKGRATFFPLTSMKGQAPSREMTEASKLDGFIAVASELVDCEQKFSNIVSSLLSRTSVFDNIDNANAAAGKLGYRLRIVTLDGQQINVGGSFTGGSVNRNGGMLTRASEIKHLEEELSGLENDTDAVKGEIDTLVESAAELEDNISECERSRHLTEAMANSILPEYEKLNAQLETNMTLLEKMRSEISTIQSKRAEYEEQAETLTNELKRIEDQMSEIQAFRERKTVEANNLEDEAEKLEGSVTELYIRVSNLEKDVETNTTLIENSESRINEVLKSIEALTAKKSEHIKDMEKYGKALEVNRRSAEEGSIEFAKLNAERGNIEETGAEYEQRITGLSARIRELHTEKELALKNRMLVENKLEGFKSEHDKLAPELIEEYGLTRADALKLGYSAISDDEERRSLTAIQTECRNKLRAIGHVDLGAVEKYDELKVRYDEMSANLKDIKESEEKIRAEIKDLDDCMKTTFIGAFNKINENFSRVFSELFGGGHAEVTLTEPDDVLNSGIEIKAAPPGKIIKSLMQLSGGEQSFVAIALFFAIIQVNPTPFCILDEIEAALDDANVSRFASYIKRYSDETQFIVISHRRGTMEAAERLYGVTMPDRGISKVLNLVLSEFSGKGDKKLDELFG